MADFILPELGENVTAGDVLRVLVKPGDTVAKDQTVLELETDKATIEVPSSVAGRVTTVTVKAGDKVKVGQVVLSVEDGQASAPPPAAKAAARPDPASAPAGGAVGANTAAKVPNGGQEQHVEGAKRPAAAVAAGGKDRSGTKTKVDPPASPDGPDQDAGGTVERARSAVPPGSASNVVDISRGARGAEAAAAPSGGPEMPPAPAAPSVRRMARELGVEIEDVYGSGSDGRISTDDVKAHARHLVENAARTSAPAGAEPLPDFARWGDVERQPMRGVRKKTAQHVSAAWRSIPHVTQNDLADVTALEGLRKKYSKDAEAAGGNLTVTAIAVKVVAAALKSFPQFNASVDMVAEEVILKKYVHIGVAVDTDRGLLVPVVRDADTKNIIQIAVEINELSAKARAGKLTLPEMQGGCFSISNLGGLGGTSFTPIVNAPEVAILGISRATLQPVFIDGEFKPRLLLPLSLSYDHRAIDGADGARFLRWIVEAIESPFMLTLEG